MSSGLPASLEFTPKEIISWSEGYIAIGVNGELQKLDDEYNPLNKSIMPFPTPIRNATVVDSKMVVTWIDSELMLARMACFDLTQDFIQGVERSDLRVRRAVDRAIHPAGNIWSHVLDAEPLAMDSKGSSFTFVLWRKGIYNMTMDALEKWRSEEPSWKKLERYPRSQETVNVIMSEKCVEVWSRGGGINRYDHENGSLIENIIIGIDGFLLKVFHGSNNYLLQLNDGYVALFDGEKITLKAKLSGPISNAKWSETSGGWFISGWREIIFLSNNSYQRKELQEIPVYYDGKRKIALCNDSNWYKVQLDEEEE
jgi:hypothetical protein